MEKLLICVCTLVVLGHVGLAVSPPKPCCMMNQWEAILGSTDTTISAHYSNIRMGIKRISMDQVNKRMAVVTNYTVGSDTSNKFIMDFINRKQYNMDSDGCRESALYVEMLPNCIPDNAKYLGSSYMGAGANTIAYHAWNYFIAGWNANISISVSQSDCTPLAEEVLTLTTDSKSAMMAVFTTFTPGIKDPDVFTPPAGCRPSDIQQPRSNPSETGEQNRM